MRLFFYLVILGAVGLIGLLIWIIQLGLSEMRQKRAFVQAIQHERNRRDNVWKEAKAIDDMVNLYMTIVCKHGPDSEEAKAFRFGTDSRLMKELHGDDEAMEAFNQQCEVIDSTYRKTKRWA